MSDIQKGDFQFFHSTNFIKFIRHFLEFDILQKASFQCDVTKTHSDYTKMHVAWYAKLVKNENKSISYNKNFMLVRQGEGFRKLKDYTNDDWMLGDRPLQDIYQGNPTIFFTGLIITDRLYDSKNLEYQTDLVSWTETLRRLTIPSYEEARHHLEKAKKMSNFCDYVEYQLLQSDVLARFVKEIREEM